MKTYYIHQVIALALLTLALFTCEDPEDVLDPINPDLSVDAVVGTVQSSERLRIGTERQLSRLINQLVPPNEIATDNYDNTQTFFNQNYDALNLDFQDQDLRELEFEIARLREQATTGIEVIVPADPGSDSLVNVELSAFYFLRGLSYSIGGENFRTLPATAAGQPVISADHFQLAIDDFTSAISTAPETSFAQAALLGRARANYYVGNRAAAVSDANSAIGNTPNLLYTAKFDPLNESGADDNVMQQAAGGRAGFDDLQPSPALDFLDPKYNDIDANVDLPIPVLKIEEAHLILAEAALSEGNIDEAKSIMSNIINLVATRPIETFTDQTEDRSERDPGSRPSTANTVVAPGPDRDFLTGLVLDRQAATISVSRVSGTSFDDSQIDAIDDIDFAYEELYRLRQQIFFAEGRRFTDLGLRFPVSLRESDANENVTDEDNQAVIPSFYSGQDLDAFTFNSDSTEVTILTNVNKLISQNRSSDLVVPFE